MGRCAALYVPLTVVLFIFNSSLCEAYPTQYSINADMYGSRFVSNGMDTFLLYLLLVIFVVGLVINRKIKEFLTIMWEFSRMIIAVTVMVLGISFLLTPYVGTNIAIAIEIYLTYKYINYMGKAR